MGNAHRRRGGFSSKGDIDTELENDKIEDQKVKKLLLLGAGESGKSTFFKQMITLYGKGYSDSERKILRTAVYNNTIQAMQVLIDASKKLYKKDDPKTHRFHVADENCGIRDEIKRLKINVGLSPENAEAIKTLWEDPGIQEAYNESYRFQLIDTADYFFNNLDTIGKRSYIPTVEDILRTRVRTTGIVETDFSMDEKDDYTYRMVDVGGQRNERKKWMHCFEGVTAVIFVSSIASYNQVLFEDEKTNRLREALSLFQDVCNYPWFEKTSMILFLNKRDLFVAKIRRFPLEVCFQEFETDENWGDKELFENTTNYIIKQFHSKNKFEEKVIYTHVTCATDKENIKIVFDAVKHIILTASLEKLDLY